jgi:hypothetical protein
MKRPTPVVMTDLDESLKQNISILDENVTVTEHISPVIQEEIPFL